MGLSFSCLLVAWFCSYRAPDPAGVGRRVYFRWVRGIDFAVAVLDLLCHIARRDQ
jgi:hypothetical protein